MNKREELNKRTQKIKLFEQLDRLKKESDVVEKLFEIKVQQITGTAYKRKHELLIRVDKIDHVDEKIKSIEILAQASLEEAKLAKQRKLLDIDTKIEKIKNSIKEIDMLLSL